MMRRLAVGLTLSVWFLASTAWGAAAISAAILPDARSGTVGETVTIFATVAAAGETATGCSIRPQNALPAEFLFQTTDAATNALTGTPNTPVAIAAGGAQSFVLAFTPTAEFSQTAVTFVFDCENSAPAPVAGVNTLLLSASSAPTPDVIAVAAAPGGTGTLGLTADGSSDAFAVAAVNVGVGGSISVDVDRQGFASLVDVFACQTDAAGACVTPASPAVLPLVTTLEANVPVTFSFFSNTNAYIRFAPGENRLRVVFNDASDITRGATSVAVNAVPTDFTDISLTELAESRGLTGDPTRGRNLPHISDPLPQLGKLLFFSKSLGGDQQTACASCHHPVLGGADDLALPVGTDAVDPDLVGQGRRHTAGVPLVGRHAPSVFNTGLYDKGLFWDSRVESLGKLPGRGGQGSGIRTPDSAFGVADPDAGIYLLSAQARFPVTEPDEMRADFRSNDSNALLRDHLAARVGNYGSGSGVLSPNEWLPLFQEAFQSGADAATLITFANIAEAIAEYQRSMVFVETPWKRYLEGDLNALDSQAKSGALLFLRDRIDGGLQCAQCHTGDFFTNEGHHNVAVPQIGRGKGNGTADDFGRENQTGNSADRYRFRTPTVLNVEVNPPYFHTGAFASLFELVEHYAVPEDSIEEYFDQTRWCGLPQFFAIPGCTSLFSNGRANTEAAFAKVQDERANNPEIAMPPLEGTTTPQLGPATVAFLRALTDPCTQDRACLAPWIPEPEESPDGNQLNAVDQQGNPL